MNQHAAEAEALLSSDTRAVQAGLQRMWDAARKAGERIRLLREENASMAGRLAETQAELELLREELRKKEELIRRTLERPLPAAAREGGVHVNGDREALARQVRALLDKLDAYL